MLGQRVAEEGAQLVLIGTGVRRGDHVGHELALGAGVAGADDDARLDRAVGVQRGCDLAGLDAEAADAQLVVEPTEELDLAVRSSRTRSPVR